MDGRRVVASLWSKSVAVFGLGFLALFVQAAQAQGPLNYFKNYFVTGDYAVGGAGLYGKAVNGSVTGNIKFSGVPCTSGPGLFASVVPCTAPGALPADVIAAFLYWQAIETTATPSYGSGTFNATPSNPNPFLSVQVGNINVPACTAGGTQAGSSGPYTRVYRADVLRYLPINTTANVRVANGTQTFQLTSNSTGTPPHPATTQFVGATLVVVYRLVTPGNPRIAPLRSVILYDGVFTGTASASLNQTMGGFYQASVYPEAKMTQIAGNGQTISRGETQTLSVNGSLVSGVPVDPFVGAQGANWDNYTFNFNLPPNASSVETKVQPTDCLSWAAIITSTNVQDTDGDGLLDIWETSGLALNPGVRNDGTPTPTAPAPATFGTCASPSSTNCVNLPKMGANPLVPDIFMQIDWMQSQGLSNPNHIHNPQLAALNMVGSTFQSHGINMHFDVGASSTYQGQGSPYIIPAAYAQGGNVVQESSVLCQYPPAAPSCSFSPQSGEFSVLGWKTGFDAIKNGDPYFPCPIPIVPAPNPPPPACTPLGTAQKPGLPQLFAQNRKDTFHYALFAHAISATSPLSTPNLASISGVADRPGGDLMVTLGLWRSDIPAADQAGTVLQQAGTLMHELGHNLDLSHAGWNTTPNCMPNYPSIMNYLYQTRGLTDASGNEHIDYSYGLELLPLSEDFLSSSFPMGFQNYRVRYFGPLNDLTNSQGQAAQAHCDGTLTTTGVGLSEGPYIRLEGPAVSTPDWSNGTIPLGTIIKNGLDINYNGIQGETFFDQPDWISLNLQQVAARPNADGLSLNIGVSDIGVSDIGVSDIGVSDIGVSDIGVSDIGVSDIGVSDIGVSDIGTANLGQDSLGDEDYISHLLSGVDPPPSPSSGCPTCGLTVVNQIAGNLLNWTATDSGPVAYYNIYRCNATNGACTPVRPALASTSGSPAPTTYTDTVNDFVHAGLTCPATATCYNTPYTYHVTAVVNVVIGNGSMIPSESGPSNNAGNQVNHLFVIANSQAITYGAALPNPTPTFTVYGNGPSSAPVTSGLPSPVSCVYNPSPSLNLGGYIDAGPYQITCSGPATTSATDGVSYNAPYLTYTPGSLTVNPRPITVTAAASSRVYDAMTDSTATPTITTGSLVTGDTVTWTETYDNQNVLSPLASHVMTPAGTVNDGKGGRNYAVTFVTINTGVITPAPLTASIIGNPSRPYNGTTTATLTPANFSLSGLQGATDNFTVTLTVGTYNSPNVATATTVTASLAATNFTPLNGTLATNYTLPTTASGAGQIIPVTLTASIVGNPTRPYNGTAAAALTSTNFSLSGLVSPDSFTVTQTVGTYNSPNVGTATTVTASLTSGNFTALGATLATNYTLPTTASGAGNITAAPVTAAIVGVGKTYDTTTAASAGCTLTSGVFPADSGNVACGIVGVAMFTSPNAGTWPVTATVSLTGTAAGNYSVSSTTPGMATIAPATAAITVTPYNVDYDGNPHTAAGTATGVGGANLIADLNLSNTTNTSPGVYSSDSWSFTDPAGNYYPVAATTITDTISDSIDLTALALNGVNYGSNTPALPMLNGTTLQLTNASMETASAWLGTAIPVASAFTTTFQFQITPASTGPNSIGDGFAFVIQGAPTGNATLGATGYGMYIGYDAIPNSVAIEFDTYENGQYGDPGSPHIGIQSNGTGENSPDHTSSANLGGPVVPVSTFADGAFHTATITYDGNTSISVSLDSGSTVVTATLPAPLSSFLGLTGNSAYVGFTAATGGAQENSDILSWTWN
jgi:hypothetical protein